jgi:glycosyltransferase involved in cell wall biosynthesis
MSVTYITTTGYRPQAFALCEKYMARQTYKGEVQWIVVDDGSDSNPTKCTMGQQYVRGPKQWKPGINTQRYSLDAAIPLVKGDYVLIIEDDEWWHPTYVETYVDFLKYADLIGEGEATYYSLKVKGFKEMNNYTHASLCQTGFNKKYLPVFERAVGSAEKFIDIVLWNLARANRHKYMFFHGLKLCVGMKGLPGRDGIGYGHTNTSEFIKDSNWVKLIELVGKDDAQAYIKMVTR